VDFPRDSLAAGVQTVAEQGIFVGASSWKYEGWLGLIYRPERYMTRGKLSRSKFEKTCLTEYAEVFKTVCLDAGFYQFPGAKMLDGIFTQVPSDFRLTIKVTEDITVKKFPNLPRYGRRAGQSNEHFLDADLFIANFLGPLEQYRERVGTLIFEFGHFHAGDWERGRQFVEALDGFFSRLPKGWNYSVEIRNQNFLQAEYFEVLHRHGVAHAFNSWSRMPSVTEQMEMPRSFTADFATARFLLKPGRNYEQAVQKFQPYSEVKEPNLDARMALIDLLTTPAKAGRPGRRFLYVNNRLEGCALWTIYAAISGLLAQPNKMSEAKSGQA
jgi:uncharacterized protein YecE (DUF72 family)